MAVSTGKKRKVYYGEDSFVEDVVEKLGLEILPEQVLVDLRAMTGGLQRTSSKMAATIYEVLLNNDLVSGDASWLLKILKICDSQSLEEEEDQSSLSDVAYNLVKRYKKGLSLAPSDVTWDVLHHLGLVKLTVYQLVTAAFKSTVDIQRCRLDGLGDLKAALVRLAVNDHLNESLLSAVCGVVFGQCVFWLETKCQGKFTFRLGKSITGQRGFSDLTILRIEKQISSQSDEVVALVEIKTDVPAAVNQFVDAVHSKSLAQLLYMGYVIKKSQRFMPLLILTNCCIWHIFDMPDIDARPNRYCFVPAGGSLPLSTHSNFDAVAVCSEIIAFVLRNETQSK